MAELRRGWTFFFSCCLVLDLMPYLFTAGASRLIPAAHTDFQSNSEKVLRAELMHRDHPDSPLSLPRGTSSADRIAAATRREKARFARRLGAADFKTAMTLDPTGGEYLMTLYFGTPAQKFTMIVDTGSDLVWIQCVPCNPPDNKCFSSPNPYFDPTASTTYSTVPCADSSRCAPSVFNGAQCDNGNNCHISYAYVDGNGVAGTFSTETISLSNSTSGIPNFLFGCMNNDTSAFGNADGLVGFGSGFISLPRQFSTSNSLNVFSYCLVTYGAATTLTSSLLFGVSNPDALTLEYTPIIRPNVYDVTSYYVNMTGISINGTNVGIPSTSFQYDPTTGDSGVIFDSGTTYLTFKRNIFTNVEQTLKGLITYPTVQLPNISSLCYNISGVQQPNYPSVSLHFSGVDGTIVDFPLAKQNIFPSNYTGSVDVDCLTISPVDGVGQNFIGNIAQGDHYIEYDVVNSVIGWASRDCSIPW